MVMETFNALTPLVINDEVEYITELENDLFDEVIKIRTYEGHTYTLPKLWWDETPHEEYEDPEGNTFIFERRGLGGMSTK